MIDNYDALTLGHYMKVNAILEAGGDDLEKQVKIIAILADMTPDQVMMLPIADYSSMAAKTAFLRMPCATRELPEGWTYQDLIPTKDFTKINTAQYVDFQGLAKGFPDTLPEILAVFMVPKGHDYNDGYDLAAVQEQVKGIPFPLAMAASAFFLGRFSVSIADSLTYLDNALGRVKDPNKKATLQKKVLLVQSLLESVGVG